MGAESATVRWGPIRGQMASSALFPLAVPATRDRVAPTDSQTARLAEGLRRAERSAFEAVYERELPYVMALLTRGFSYRSAGVLQRVSGLPSAFDAEDLCQEAFRRFFERCRDGGYDVERPVRPYLTRIVVNLAFKKFARERREAPLDDLELAGPTVPDRLEQAECAALLDEFRESLNERQQAVFHGYFQAREGSQAEVAAGLGLSRDQVARTVLTIREKSFTFFRKRGWFDEP